MFRPPCSVHLLFFYCARGTDVRAEAAADADRLVDDGLLRRAVPHQAGAAENPRAEPVAAAGIAATFLLVNLHAISIRNLPFCLEQLAYMPHDDDPGPGFLPHHLADCNRGLRKSKGVTNPHLGADR